MGWLFCNRHIHDTHQMGWGPIGELVKIVKIYGRKDISAFVLPMYFQMVHHASAAGRVKVAAAATVGWCGVLHDNLK